VCDWPTRPCHPCSKYTLNARFTTSVILMPSDSASRWIIRMNGFSTWYVWHAGALASRVPWVLVRESHPPPLSPRDPSGGPTHTDKRAVCLAPLVGPGGGCPGHRRWESAGSEGRLPLDHQGIKLCFRYSSPMLHARRNGYEGITGELRAR
jgi:hypothetical protein